MRKYPEIIKKRTENQLIKSFIEQFEKVISGSNYKNKRFSFVLTGGNSPKKLYKKLSVSIKNWKNIDFFWGDERIVSKNSVNSNYNLVNKFLFNNNEIKKKHGEGSVVDYYGLTPQEERQNNIKKFQEDDKCRFFVGTTQTGGYGITLTAASTMIYFSNGYDLEKRQQSEARIDRIGQEKPMTYIDIMTEETIDEKIVKALRKKINIATEIMGEELKEWI